MKILVVTQYYYPENFRINDICEELVRRGNNVTVVTGMPSYPKGEIFKGYENAYKRPCQINGVKVYRCNSRPRKNGIINLLLSYISFFKKASKMIKKMDNDFDVVYAYQLSPITLVIPGIKYKRKNSVPLFIYVCDIWPESIRDLGNNKNIGTHNFVYLFFKWLSKRIYSEADIISVKCNEFIDYLADVCNVDKRKCFLNFEHAEDNYLKVSENPEDNGIIDFMFLGNIGHSSNCDLILRVCSKLDGDNYKIHFVGEGSELDNLIRLSKDLGLDDKVVFHGRVSQTEVVNFYNVADVCILTLSGKSAIGLTPPAKLTGYMAASRPIVASANGATQTIIKAAKCGFVCDADDFNSLLSIMQSIIDNPTIINSLGKNGRDYFLEKFTLEKHIDRFEEILKEGLDL